MENLEKHTATISIATAEDLYDLSMLKEMDDTEYLLEVLTILLRETPKDIKDMKEAIIAGKIDIICQKAHKLKSSAGAIQAEKLVKMLEHIESIGKKGAISDELIFLVENASHQYNRIENALNIHVKRLIK